MSKLKNMPAAGWVVVGISVAVLLIPTTVGAVAALKFTGIEGTSTNKADVTSAGQLKVAAADPSTYFQNSSTVLPPGSATLGGPGPWVPVAVPISGSGLVVDVVHNYASGYGFALEIQTGSACAGSVVGTYLQKAFGGTEQDIQLTPGLAVPAGDALCAQALTSQGVGGVSVSGYTVPSSAIPASGG
jgi:hypothetical protein